MTIEEARKKGLRAFSPRKVHDSTYYVEIVSLPRYEGETLYLHNNGILKGYDNTDRSVYFTSEEAAEKAIDKLHTKVLNLRKLYGLGGAS